MTEADWLQCTDPKAMLDFLRGKASDRKLRLFAVACCRQVWHLITADACLRAVEAAERFADGQMTASELVDADERCRSAVIRAASDDYLRAVNMCVIRQATSSEEPYQNAPYRASHFAADLGSQTVPFDVARKHQSAILHDLFDNLIRPVSLDPTCIAPAICTFARTMYVERSFHAMPQLADALEQAGCEDADILAHCRGQGPHVRGCWVLDLLLGK